MINWWLVTAFFGLSWSSNHHFSWISKPALACLWHGVLRLQISSAGNWQEGSRACHFRCHLSSSSLFYPNWWHLCFSVRVAAFIIFVKVTKLLFLGQDWSSWWWGSTYMAACFSSPRYRSILFGDMPAVEFLRSHFVFCFQPQHKEMKDFGGIRLRVCLWLLSI